MGLVSWVSFLFIATWPASVESRSASSLFDVAELTRIVGGVEVSISFPKLERIYIIYLRRGSVKCRRIDLLLILYLIPPSINSLQAQEGRYPYVVSMTKGGLHFCGGSLIAKDVVLTAA